VVDVVEQNRAVLAQKRGRGDLAGDLRVDGFGREVGVAHEDDAAGLEAALELDGVRRDQLGLAEERHQPVDAVAAHVHDGTVREGGVEGVDARLARADAVVAGGILRELEARAAQAADARQVFPHDGQRVVEDEAHGLEEHDALGPRGRDQRAHLARVRRDGVFAEHMLVMAQEQQRLLVVAADGAREVDGVHLRAFGHLLEAREDERQTVFGGELAAGGLRAGAHGDGMQLRHLFGGREHPVHDEVAADNAETNHRRISFLMRRGASWCGPCRRRRPP